MPTLEIYRRADGRTWAWRLRSGNGAIVATDGGQGYESQVECRLMGQAVIGGEYRFAKVEHVA